MPRIDIDDDIRLSSTLPAGVYSNPAYFTLQQVRVFARTWQYAADASRVKAAGRIGLQSGDFRQAVIETRSGARRCERYCQ